jgi:hypothetical protein
MKILLFGIMGAFIAINAFGGHDCIPLKYKGMERENLGKIISHADQSGTYTMKSLFGKNIVFKKGQMWKVAGTKVNCKKQDCRLGGFCETLVVKAGKGSMGVSQLIEKYCIGIKLARRSDPMTGQSIYGCFDLESVEPVR